MSPSLSPEWPVPVSVAPDKLAGIQARFSDDWAHMVSSAGRGTLEPPADRRFSSPAWSENPSALIMAHTHLLSVQALNQMVEAANVTESVRNRLRFSVMQWVDAMSPSNFLATNPDAQRTLVQSNGESLRLGIGNLLEDLRKGRMSQTDESSFELGRNIGVAKGAVVFENAYMQLIQYAPQTSKVYERPLLIVPPCINKFYILDLQPENSFVRHAVEQGFTVFMISWRNPLASDDDGIDTAGWDDYVQDGVLAALDVASDISGQEQVNALGFCVGGTLLACALALARARGKNPVGSLTLLTTLLDYHDTGVLDVFVDEMQVQTREFQLGRGGLMPARELATTFSFLRPNELVWNYVVNNYLKGLSPASFDLLFWNADSTNLPGPFFTWYFRNTYLEDNLKVPGRVKIDGHAIDLGSLTMPAYIYGSREDHIVPWQSSYASTRILRGPLRFVLGASGHIAGVINPPAKKRRHYWAHETTHTEVPGDPQVWLDKAVRHSGSWWPDWQLWLASHSGGQKRSRAVLGNKRHMPIEAAPGRYVKVRAM